jgi:hypothetical protein
MVHNVHMNRRNFLGSLAVLPFFSSRIKAADTTPNKVLMRNSWDILSPKEITEAGFALVTTPTFLVDDQNYCIVTKKLHLWLPPERVGHPISDECKLEAICQINVIGFTHVYSVKFNESPVYNPTTFESAGHMAFVRGATIHWYRGSVYEATTRKV